MSKRFFLSVPKQWLFLLAGLMWSGVGILLCSFAYRWLVDLHSAGAVWSGAVGAAAALIIYRFGFLGIARKNINRLNQYFEQACLFAFISGKSYVLVAFMMTLGIVLRNSPIPREYLAILYSGIGAALFLSSLHYYSQIGKLTRIPNNSG
jgi:hypothetical protein